MLHMAGEVHTFGDYDKDAVDDRDLILPNGSLNNDHKVLVERAGIFTTYYGTRDLTDTEKEHLLAEFKRKILNLFKVREDSWIIVDKPRKKDSYKGSYGVKVIIER